MRALFVVAAFLAPFAAALPALAQVVSGKLVEQGSERPVVRATVELMDGNSRRGRTVTDSAGRFALPVPGRGTYRLRLSRLGYQPSLSQVMSIATLDSLDVTFQLAANTVELRPLEVKASSRRVPPWLAGFYQRMDSGNNGRFISRSQIQAWQPTQATDVLRAIPGVTVVPHRSGHGNFVRVRGCIPLFFIDGLQIDLYGTSVDDYLNARDIEGIEVYSGPSTIPAEFSRAGRGNCGAVIVWTRLDQ
ncbi:MAG TPA: carboxypeptidase regulatory-like domain-containing protein [Longimicrobium sp.]|nr:carboxypeptidase regulatory-like domain-containing protein [Longimicrobium sp.]